MSSDDQTLQPPAPPQAPNDDLPGLLADLPTGGSATRLSARGERRREAILRAAITQVRRQGFANTTMDDIGRAAGVTGPALYHHFKNKQQVLAAAMWQLGDDLLVGLREGWRESFTPWERVEYVVRHHTHAAMEHAEAFPVLFVEDRNLTPEDLATTWERRRHLVDILAWTVHEVRPDLSLDQCASIAATLHVLVGAHTFLPARVDGPALEALIVEMSLAIIRGTRVPPMLTEGDEQ